LNAAAAGVLSGTAVVIILISEVIVGSPAWVGRPGFTERPPAGRKALRWPFSFSGPP